MAKISLNNISLDFPVFGVKSRSIKQGFLDFASGGKLSRSSNVPVVRALDQISFTISNGDKVGIIGKNGAGKSTLLRVLSRVYEPLIGNIKIEGNISSLIDFSLGLEHDSTGIENIKLLAALGGLSLDNIESKIDEVIAFSELGEYLYMPLHAYSSGMLLRLAFAIAVQTSPEILILDEVVNVGDSGFVKKARKKIDSLLKKTSIFLLASHDQALIEKLCNKVIWLENGRLVLFGETQEVLKKYSNSI